jgi:hypothetical protein
MLLCELIFLFLLLLCISEQLAQPGGRTLPQLVHCQSMHDDSEGPGYHLAHVDCIRAAVTLSI